MKVRPAVAEAFYHGDCAAELGAFLEGYDAPKLERTIPGAIVPHAGWAYSGRVAGRVWARIAGAGPPETIIIFGAVHGHYEPAGAAIWAEGRWESVVGGVDIDRDTSAELVEACGHLLRVNPAAHLSEHSIEVQIPMIKLLLPQARIVPIAVPPDESACEVGAVVGEFLNRSGKPATVVATTDLTHYGASYGFVPAGAGKNAEEWMIANDQSMIALMGKMDRGGVLREARANHNACGPGAVAAAIGAAAKMGAVRGDLVEYTTSFREAPESGGFATAVGYVGMLFLS